MFIAFIHMYFFFKVIIFIELKNVREINKNCYWCIVRSEFYFFSLSLRLPVCSEKTEQSTSGERATNEDISNANNNMANASSPTEDKSLECGTVSNNNWWGSWINSAKTKVR